MYNSFFEKYIEYRGVIANGVGVNTVHSWVKQFQYNSEILDLGCGTGMPISNVLINAGMLVKGIDNAPKMCQAFRTNFPKSEISCENVLESSFFNKTFDGILGWGIIFLFDAEEQELLIEKVAQHIKQKGKFLFTAPKEACFWQDMLTGQKLQSLGKSKYVQICHKYQLKLSDTFTDSGDNNYYNFVKQ